MTFMIQLKPGGKWIEPKVTSITGLESVINTERKEDFPWPKPGDIAFTTEVKLTHKTARKLKRLFSGCRSLRRAPHLPRKLKKKIKKRIELWMKLQTLAEG